MVDEDEKQNPSTETKNDEEEDRNNRKLDEEKILSHQTLFFIDSDSDSDSDFESQRPRLDSVYPSSIPVPLRAASAGQNSSSQQSLKTIAIPDAMVGAVIGQGGERINSIEQKSGARIQIFRKTDIDPDSLTRSVVLRGTVHQQQRAERLINRALERVQQQSYIMNSGPSDSTPSIMRVPNHRVAALIENFENIQIISGAQIRPLDLPQSDTSRGRLVFIDGLAEQIESAEEMIKILIDGPVYPPPGQPPTQQRPGYGYEQPGPSFAPQYYGGYPTQPVDSFDHSNQQAPTNLSYGYYQAHPYGQGYFQQPSSYEQGSSSHTQQSYIMNSGPYDSTPSIMRVPNHRVAALIENMENIQIISGAQPVYPPPGQHPTQQHPGYGYEQPGPSFAPQYYGGYPTQPVGSFAPQAHPYGQSYFQQPSSYEQGSSSQAPPLDHQQKPYLRPGEGPTAMSHAGYGITPTYGVPPALLAYGVPQPIQVALTSLSYLPHPFPAPSYRSQPTMVFQRSYGSGSYLPHPSPALPNSAQVTILPAGPTTQPNSEATPEEHINDDEQNGASSES